MNKKERKRRLWKSNFQKRYQQVFWKASELALGIPADRACYYIAQLAQRLSNGCLQTQEGILLFDDQEAGQADPVTTRHFWNVLDGQRFDLSPWGSRPRVEYYSPNDDDYEWYDQQAPPFPDGRNESYLEYLEEIVRALVNGKEVITQFGSSSSPNEKALRVASFEDEIANSFLLQSKSVTPDAHQSFASASSTAALGSMSR